MSQMLNSDSETRHLAFSHSSEISAADTEALLQTVREQLILQTFDPSNHSLLMQMVESLGDPRGMIRLGFADALGQIGKPVVPLLLEALAHHPNVVVRRAAGKTLTLIADPTAVPHLINALLNDEDMVVKGSVVGALARTGEAAVPALLKILSASEYPESTKGHASWALAFMGTEVKEILYQEIASDSADVRVAVVGALTKVAQDTSEEKSFQLLMDALGDPAATVRCEAAAALGNLAYEPALPPLMELLHHVDGESRKSAALALMKIGDARALDALDAALTQEAEAAVRRVMELAISQISPD